MSILTKAWELGAAISQSSELLEVRTAEQAMFADSDARALIEEFQRFRQELESAQAQGMQPSPEQQESFASVRSRMNANQLISHFMEAQDNFDRILRQINQILNQAITGGQGCSSEGCAGCGGGCEES
ncbi:MAG: YlbF family regulator [Bacillota bacterium]